MEWLGKKIEAEVFDIKTLKLLAKIHNKGILKTLDWPISTGKEANVFRATGYKKDYLAVKIYRRETTGFIRRKKYFEGDPRFNNVKYTLETSAALFARKEYKNLRIAERAKVHSPIPVYVKDHILVMSFLGKGGVPFPTVKDAFLKIKIHYGIENIWKRIEKAITELIKDMKRLYINGIVHSDLSEYNMLFDAESGIFYIVDYSQGVVLRHPHAHAFLMRDIRNICTFIKKIGFSVHETEVYNYITSISGMPRIRKRNNIA